MHRTGIATHITTRLEQRFRHYTSDFAFKVVYNRFGNEDGNVRTKKLKSPPPHNLTIYKNNVATTLTRALVEHGVRSPIAIALRQWLRDTDMPDEHFWATLVGNEHLLPERAAAYQSQVCRYTSVKDNITLSYTEPTTLCDSLRAMA